MPEHHQSEPSSDHPRNHNPSVDPALRACLSSRSTVYTKTDPDFRRALDRAIVDHQPGTYRAIYDLFNLKQRNISFTSFYLYARRIRLMVESRLVAGLALPDARYPDREIADLIAGRLCDLLLDPDTPFQPIARLTEAYARVARKDLDARRRALDAERADRALSKFKQMQ